MMIGWEGGPIKIQVSGMEEREVCCEEDEEELTIGSDVGIKPRPIV